MSKLKCHKGQYIHCYRHSDALLFVDTAIAEHVSRLRQQVTDAEAEASRLQTSLEEMRRRSEEQTAAAVDAERHQLHDEFNARLETVTQQCKYTVTQKMSNFSLVVM